MSDVTRKTRLLSFFRNNHPCHSSKGFYRRRIGRYRLRFLIKVSAMVYGHLLQKFRFDGKLIACKNVWEEAGYGERSLAPHGTLYRAAVVGGSVRSVGLRLAEYASKGGFRARYSAHS